MSKLKTIEEILTRLENVVSQDTAQRLSGNGGRISPKHHHAQALADLSTIVRDAELERFAYVDWDTGNDNKLRMGDYINCNHQRVFDGYEQNFEGQIVAHHDNGMPVIIHNVDPKEPDNSGDYVTLQDLYLNGWEFSRLKALTTDKET